ncbi:MAG: response regulator [Cyanobacteriota bacterium]|nr:response regulator [Cyanobacteriota bacterium]
MKTVLIVEDSLTDLAIMKGCFQKSGWSVLTANSGDEANKKIASPAPDLIVLDVILPDKSGFEICRDLKKNPTTSKIPVIICSTKNTDVDKMWGNMLGADAYLSKPVQHEDLMEAIKRLVKG